MTRGRHRVQHGIFFEMGGRGHEVHDGFGGCWFGHGRAEEREDEGGRGCGGRGRGGRGGRGGGRGADGSGHRGRGDRQGHGGRGGLFHHGPPSWVREMLGGGNRRADRGEARYLILETFAEQPRHGYDVIQAIESRTGGAYRPSPGTVYPTLQMLEELGHLVSHTEAGKRVYEITDAGKEDLEAHRDDIEDTYDRLGFDSEWAAGREFHALFHRFRKVMRTLGRAFHRGQLDEEQMRGIHAAINDALDHIEAQIRGSQGPRE